MHPKKHNLLNHNNLIEFLFQSPFWIIMYGSGLVIPLSALTWVLYGLGLYYHPKRYPLPHIAFLDFFAETMIWVRTESSYPKLIKKIINLILTTMAVIGIPYLFYIYFNYLFDVWYRGEIVPIKDLLNLWK